MIEPTETITLTIRLPKDLHKKLGHYCVDAETSLNAVILELVRKFLEGKKR